MAVEDTTGTLTITAERAGTVVEISQFLADLEGAYLQLYRLEHLWATKRSRRMFDRYMDIGFPYPLLELPSTEVLSPETVLPEHRLVVKRIRIESPGFWEFAASLNPLQQIREYLNDRHKRRRWVFTRSSAIMIGGGTVSGYAMRWRQMALRFWMIK